MIDFSDVLAFRHQFKFIHSFREENGQVGRMIMPRECLKHKLTPFIISVERREAYINGLKNYQSNPDILHQRS